MLVIDVGNSETTLGYFSGMELKHHWRLQTRSGVTADELAAILFPLLQRADLQPTKIKRLMIASVVPALNAPLAELFHFAKVTFVTHQLNFGFKIALENPAQIGADRLANAQAVANIYKRAAIIVDAGTATTFCVLSPELHYLGGAIAPGLQVASQALISRAARLAHIDLVPNTHLLGKSTESAMRSGMVNAHAVMINAMVDQLKAELGFEKCLSIATGGYVNLLQPLLTRIDHFEPHLTLRGLYLLAEANPC